MIKNLVRFMHEQEQFFYNKNSGINLIREMQIANQQMPTIYYYPAYQNNNLMSAHLNQAHSNGHIYHRVDSSLNQKHLDQQKMNPEQEMVKNKYNTHERETQNHINRNETNKGHSFSSIESPVPRHGYFDQQNIQNCSLNANKSSTQMINDSGSRNRSVFQVKRKQSSNVNLNTNPNLLSKDVRQEYYKGHQMHQQQREELMNKLPQIQLQQINKAGLKYNQISPSKSPHFKQLKKNTSPSAFKFRSSSIKQHSLEGLALKKSESVLQNDDGKKIKQISLKTLHTLKRESLQTDASLNSPLDVYSKSALNTDRNNSSCSTNHGNSNTNSMCFQQIPKNQGVKIKNTYQFFNKKQSGKDEQSQTALQTQSNIDVTKIKDSIKILEKQIQQLRNICHQKDVKLRQIQHEMNSQKIAAQKKLLITERELVTKRQSDIMLLKQQYQKQISKIVGEMKQKYSFQQKQMEYKFQNTIHQLKMQYDDIKVQNQRIQGQKNQILASIQNQQNIMILKDQKIKDLQRIKGVYQEKNIKLQENSQRQRQQIESLLSGPIIERQEKSINSDSKFNEQEYKQKMKVLQQKILQYLQNMDKQSQQLKQSKQQAQKYKRRSQQFNFVIVDKQALIKSLYKDLKAIEKQLVDSKKFNEKIGEMLNLENDEIVNLNAKLLNQKYKNMKIQT